MYFHMMNKLKNSAIRKASFVQLLVDKLNITLDLKCEEMNCFSLNCPCAFTDRSTRCHDYKYRGMSQRGERIMCYQ